MMKPVSGCVSFRSERPVAGVCFRLSGKHIKVRGGDALPYNRGEAVRRVTHGS